MTTYHYLYYMMEMFTHRLPLRNQVEGQRERKREKEKQGCARSMYDPQ